MLTTEAEPYLNMAKRTKIITTECATTMSVAKVLFTQDIVGGRFESVQKTMREAHKTVLYELKKEAYEVAANADVDVDWHYVVLRSAGSIQMRVASETAVMVEK